MTEKKCSICHDPKPLTDFSRQAQSADGRKAYCNACEKKRREQKKIEQEQYSKKFFTH